jgi:hypothetical protein
MQGSPSSSWLAVGDEMPNLTSSALSMALRAATVKGAFVPASSSQEFQDADRVALLLHREKPTVWGRKKHAHKKIMMTCKEKDVMGCSLFWSFVFRCLRLVCHFAGVVGLQSVGRKHCFGREEGYAGGVRAAGQ